MRLLLPCLVCVLGACRPSSESTSSPEPAPTPSVADEPAPSTTTADPQQTTPQVVPPMLRGHYVQQEKTEGLSAIYHRVAYVFEGNTISARVLMAFEPEGDAAASTNRICVAAVRVPVRWTEFGFEVERDATAEGQAITYERTEESVEAEDHDYVASWDRTAWNCSIILRAGTYRLRSVSEARAMDRPREVVFVHDDDTITLRVAEPEDETKDLKRGIEAYFGRTPNLD